MPAMSPLPTPRPDDALSRSRNGAPIATMASIRKSLVTPSPTGTAVTEAMTPVANTPQASDMSTWSFSSESVDVPDDTSRLSRSYDDLDRGEDTHDERSPDGEWRVRDLLFRGKAHKSPSPENKRSRSLIENCSPILPLPQRSSFNCNNISESSLVSTSRLKQSRRKKIQSHPLHSSSGQAEDEWSGDFVNAARRRTSSNAFFSPELQNRNLMVETPPTCPSSEGSPDESPNRSNGNRKRLSNKCTSPVQETDVSTLKACRVANNQLLFILCMVAFISLVFTVLTSRAVIEGENVIDNEELGKVMTNFERIHQPTGSNGTPGGGLRNVVHLTGKVDHSKGPKKNDGHDMKGNDIKTKEEIAPESNSDENQELSDKAKTTSPVTATKASKKVELIPKKLTVTPIPRKKHVKPTFNDVDLKMFDHYAKPNDMQPRVLYLHNSITQKNAPVHRHVPLYPSDYTDSTQLYGVLDSGDTRLSRMELRDPYEDEHCVPMKEWQTTFHPSCNGMHEIALDHMVTDDENDINLFGTKGYWRNAWRVDVLAGNHRKEDRETVVLKTLKFEHKFEDAHFEHDRIDAVAMERLTSSPHVINVFGFCGHSVVTEYAEGTRLGELADKSKRTPLARLKIARDIAMGLADVHGIDGDGNATFVHLDINPANVVSIGGTLKLNDFNIGIILRWNQTSNQHCGFPAQYPNPQWRSPEEARNEQNLTEKVDVFAMGHIFFRLICGHEPWNKLEVGGRPSKEEVNAKVKKGVLPHIPKEIRKSTNKEEIAIRDAMLRCYTFDPSKRPSARVIANALQSALDELSASS